MMDIQRTAVQRVFHVVVKSITFDDHDTIVCTGIIMNYIIIILINTVKKIIVYIYIPEE